MASLDRIDHLQKHAPDPLIVPPHERPVADEVAKVATGAQLKYDEDVVVVEDDVAHGEDVGMVCALVVRVAFENLTVPLGRAGLGSVESFDGDFGAFWCGGVDSAEDTTEGAIANEGDQDIGVAYH